MLRIRLFVGEILRKFYNDSYTKKYQPHKFQAQKYTRKNYKVFEKNEVSERKASLIQENRGSNTKELSPNSAQF